MADRPRWFGRAHGLTTKKRLTEVMYDTCYRGGWASRIARPFGLQGVVRVNATRLLVPARKPAPTLRVAFASDLHSGPCTHPAIVAEACRALSDARPDLLLLGGDYVSFHARHVDRLVPLLKAIEAPLGKFAVLGNHDVVGDDDYITRRLADAGVRMLVNENVQLPAPHADIWICGLDNPEAGAPDADRASPARWARGWWSCTRPMASSGSGSGRTPWRSVATLTAASSGSAAARSCTSRVR